MTGAALKRLIPKRTRLTRTYAWWQDEPTTPTLLIVEAVRGGDIEMRELDGKQRSTYLTLPSKTNGMMLTEVPGGFRLHADGSEKYVEYMVGVQS